MSLALLQGYSSAEEEEEGEAENYDFQDSSGDDDGERNGIVSDYATKPLFDLPKPSSRGGSSLPSAFDAFTEVSGPPRFLNNCVEEPEPVVGDDVQRWRHGRRRNRKEKKDLPAGAVLEAKAQLTGIHERVRSDIEGKTTLASSAQPNSQLSAAQGGKRVATAANPNAEDAAELLRMCLQCGIPKTFSTAKGMVCPQCSDRPPADPNAEHTKKKGSAIKEKEKSKRMRGQSSHATWKSETEMQLRQQFD
ncbi:uncharacterized protein LOC127801197 [Diospyros lotus]|uniref:uncharacterized protein LOC127801197 n=1 Tax=Diospyros lotus TaxID=55363 RepID=UPI00224D92E5|nr:uncharacterized protein LOC127801197 [Diospyros lotus]